MSKPRFLPKKSYSLSDAVKYISLNHNIEITESDLLEYIQNGDLTASIYLEGDSSEIDAINRKEIAENERLLVRGEELFLQFSQSETNAKINKLDAREITVIDLENVYFHIKVILNNRYYPDNYFNDDTIKLYSGEIGRFKNIIFNGYFTLSNYLFERYNVSELIEQGYIDELEEIRMNTGESFYFHLPFEVNQTKIQLEDICIIHKDIIEFLELFSVTELDSRQDEKHELKIQLQKKNEEYLKLYKEFEKIKNQPNNKEVFGKSETSYLNIIQALKDELIDNTKFRNQSDLINYLSEKYTGYQGLTESNLRDKFARANLIR